MPSHYMYRHLSEGVIVYTQQCQPPICRFQRKSPMLVSAIFPLAFFTSVRYSGIARHEPISTSLHQQIRKVAYTPLVVLCGRVSRLL